MSTRSITRIKDGGLKSKTLVTIYRQSDGYPSGHGKDILEALGNRRLVNGYSDAETQVNGMQDAATMLIASIKNPKRAGNVYIVPNGDDCGQAFVYTLYKKDEKIHMQVLCKNKEGVLKYEDGIMFDGVLSDFDYEKAQKKYEVC